MDLNKIYLGDCLDLMKDIPNKSIDLVLTDPPYEIHAKSGGGLHNKRDWLKKVANANLDTFNPEVFLNAISIKMKSFHAYVFCSKNLLSDYILWIESNGYNWELLIMAKNNPIPTKNNKYLSDKEYCFFIREKGLTYFNNDLEYNEYRSVKHINVKPSQFGHPTEKNLNYIKSLIVMSSKEGQTILDPFAGSGTTAIACHDLKRNFICIEKEPAYHKIAEERYNKHKAQLELF